MDITMILLWVGIAAFGYFLLIRPGQRRAKEQQAMMASLDVGSRVMLASGVYGTVRYLGARQVVLTISPGVDLTVLRQAITKIVKPEDEDFEYDAGEQAAIETEPAGYETYDAGTAPDVHPEPAPEATQPGFTAPEATQPGFTPGSTAPGYTEPGYTAPGYTAPDYSAPGYSTPHYSTGASPEPTPQQPTDPQPPAEKN